MPSHGDPFEYGFHLRLPDGPVLERGDPLPAAYGAAIGWIEPGDEHEEQIQSAAFDPGSRLTLRAEPFDPRGPHDIGVWDADRGPAGRGSGSRGCLCRAELGARRARRRAVVPRPVGARAALRRGLPRPGYAQPRMVSARALRA